MKKIILFGPTIVNDEIRHPHENPLTVTNKEADRLHDIGALQGEPIDAGADDAPVAPQPPAIDVDAA